MVLPECEEMNVVIDFEQGALKKPRSEGTRASVLECGVSTPLWISGPR